MGVRVVHSYLLLLQEGICVILVHEPKKAFYKKARYITRLKHTSSLRSMYEAVS